MTDLREILEKVNRGELAPKKPEDPKELTRRLDKQFARQEAKSIHGIPPLEPPTITDLSKARDVVDEIHAISELRRGLDPMDHKVDSLNRKSAELSQQLRALGATGVYDSRLKDDTPPITDLGLARSLAERMRQNSIKRTELVNNTPEGAPPHPDLDPLKGQFTQMGQQLKALGASGPLDHRL